MLEPILPAANASSSLLRPWSYEELRSIRMHLFTLEIRDPPQCATSPGTASWLPHWLWGAPLQGKYSVRTCQGPLFWFVIETLNSREGSVTEAACRMNHNGSRPPNVVLAKNQDLPAPHIVEPQSQNPTSELCYRREFCWYSE